jgi:hypothetical protein
MSVGESLKIFIKTELEKLLTEKLKEMRADPSVDTASINIQQVKIADISFAFNNAEIINLLRERGGFIMRQQYDKMREVEAKITQVKNDKFKELIQPCDAFITFEEEDGGIIAQEYEPKFNYAGKKEPAIAQFMGDDLFMVEATEPTNIIWENRHFTAQEYFIRTCKVFAIVFVLISISFVIIFVCKVKAIEASSMYPTVDCRDILKTYGNWESQQQYAYREYVAYYFPDPAP